MELTFLILLALLAVGVFSIAGALGRIAAANEAWVTADTNTCSLGTSDDAEA